MSQSKVSYPGTQPNVPGLDSNTDDPEMTALTIKPPYLPLLTYRSNTCRLITST